MCSLNKDLNGPTHGVHLILQIIQMVAEGAVWIDPAIAKTVLALLSNPSILPAEHHNPDEHYNKVKKQTRKAYNTGLTEREMEVLKLITAGLSNKEIAQDLDLSINTVKTHVRNVIQKLAVEDRTQVVIKALKDGLME
jgi:NarL family two-component system response regulator LiaR